jgi:hypothetical protein
MAHSLKYLVSKANITKGGITMKKTRITSLLTFTLIVGLALAGSGCSYGLLLADHTAYKTKAFSEDVKPYAGVKGYMCEVRDIKAGGFMTPSYLPGKVKFVLCKKLRQKGILAPPSPSGKCLAVNITTGATCPPFASKGEYDKIQSRIRVIDTENGAVIAETTIHTHNPFGWDGDFAENTHAEQIGSFIEYVAR